MGRKRSTKVIALGMAVTMLVTALSVADPQSSVSAAEASAGEAVSETGNGTATYSLKKEYVSEMISNNYTKISAGYTANDYSGEDILIPAAEAVTDLGDAEITDDVYGYEKAGKAVNMVIGDTVTFSIDVPETAKYFIGFDYLSYDESVLPIALAMMLDGDYPFYECRNLKFETTWVSQEEKAFDRYNKEIVTMPDKLVQWESKYLMDGSYRYSMPLAVELEAGTHEITLSISEGGFLLGAITLEAPFSIPEYIGSEAAIGNALIQIQAENFTYRNDSSIHAVAEFDTSLDPYEVKDTLLNTIDAGSFGDAGQRITYEFYVDQPGYYYIGMNYQQSDKSDFPVFVDVAIDGAIPNTAFQSYGLAYSSKYQTASLQDEDKNRLSVYLESGTHTISFTISNDNIRHLLEGLDEVIAGVSDLALEITKVAGTNVDKYRDLKLSRYIPNLEEQLYGYVDKMYEMQDSVLHYTSSKNNVAVLSSMIIAAQQIVSLAEEPDEIPYRVGELSTSVNSANHHLANTVDYLLENYLAIDRIYLYQEDAELPENPGFFRSAWLNVSRFITSFTDQAYSTSNTDPEHLQVWVNRSSQFVQIMQTLIDESFTPQTGIQVDISIMPDQRKLVLSNTAGQSPDVATGINYTIPYELAIRDALVDMTQYEDFLETASVFEPGFFLTSCINDSIYAMPETMNFWVLFYRSDILEKLGLEVPNTMQDVIDMLPELQMRGLNFYQSASGMLAMRNFHGTTPLIHQFGGSLYGETAQEGTMLGSAASIDGFTFLTELYTLYDIPINIDNFYQHLRNGDIPLGVADFATYNLMTNAAPELKDSWKIALVPGVEQEDGTINRTVCGCAESSVIFKSDSAREQQAWEFVKWWSSTETQAKFGQTLQVIYGDTYMWATANMEAFLQLPWNTQDKLIIREQMSHVVDIARVPGTYLLEREMSNAFNDIVVDGKSAQARIDKAVKTINREIERKLEEFEYIDSEGNTLREYGIPTYDSLLKLLGRE